MAKHLCAVFDKQHVNSTDWYIFFILVLEKSFIQCKAQGYVHAREA